MPSPKKARRSVRRVPRVALLIETSRTYTRELLAGIRHYVSAHGPWSTFLELRALDSAPPPWLKHWKGDGILTRTFTPEVSALIDSTKVPAVEIRSSLYAGSRPFVGLDNARIGQSVAEHFQERGYRHFAAYRLSTEPFFEERVKNFVQSVRASGCSCAELSETTDSPKDWDASQDRLIQWLRQLPKPVGIFAANDQLGVRILDACQREDIAVPEQVAVVGAENEETLCNFATPPLTSVEFDGHSVGYAAAKLLDRLMQGEAPPKKPILVSPKGIIVRHSSDEFVITDPFVANAVRLIRENATMGMNVDTLCKRLNASRSTLERRMKTALNRSPKQEIARVRFREVERLLRETDLTVDAIAEATGFAHSHYLQALFKQISGLTPAAFRRQFRFRP
jgi:LacI family transcriptional regulator